MRLKVKTIRGTDQDDLDSNIIRFTDDPNVQLEGVSYTNDSRTEAVIIYRETYYRHP